MIVGLFTELLSVGGVQRAGRHVAAVAAEFSALHAAQQPAYRFLSLNDPAGEHFVRVGASSFAVTGYGADRLRFVRAALSAAGSDPLLVLGLHPHLAPVAAAMRLRSLRPRTMIFAHGIEVWNPLAWPRGWTLRMAETVVAPSSDTARHLTSAQHVAGGRVRVLPWGLDPEFEARVQPGAQLARPNVFPDAARVVLIVGRWDPAERYKGADTLIAAMPEVLRAVPAAFLVLVGDGGDRLRLEQLAREQGITDRTCFVTRVTQEELFACYAHCEVFALPSRGEGFGLVFLEAMALGKPVIGGAHGGIPDVIENGANGVLVTHGDVAQLSAALLKLLTDPAYARALGQTGRERAQTIFSFRQFRVNLTQILTEAVAAR